ncbi:hypothetical protein RDWZM_009780 [Blomia tropicalis]|uniref:EF-hand domain-containing protein n=1 Tax=Blomia tropicalis TaxID=40697 RepID=A0A9Q0M4N2_BLOTA|nr:hypothetical protein RDWZM_009780 [Blomia tropicalis]
MEEDEYYLDRYDCESAKVPIVSSSSSSTTATTTHPSSSSRMIPSRQASTDSSLSTPEVDNVNVMCDNDEEEEEEDYYEDDYDHLYVDTDGAEQYLREIWTQLGVGDAGYLNQNELFRVCEHIGMSASDEMIEQLFDKLDNDQDGRVSFDEFVDGLFKYVHKTATTTNYSNHQFQNENSQTHCELSSINQSPLSTSVIDADSNVSTFINEQSKTSSTNSSPKHAIGKSSSPSSTVSNSPSHCPRMNVEHMDTSTSLFITIPTDKDG